MVDQNQQVVEAQNQLEQQRREIARAKSQEIVNESQRRQATGLADLRSRQQAISQTQANISQAEQQVEARGQEITQYQKDIQAQQKEEQARNEYNIAVESVERASRHGAGALGLLAVYGSGTEKALAKEALKGIDYSGVRFSEIKGKEIEVPKEFALKYKNQPTLVNEDIISKPSSINQPLNIESQKILSSTIVQKTKLDTGTVSPKIENYVSGIYDQDTMQKVGNEKVKVIEKDVTGNKVIIRNLEDLPATKSTIQLNPPKVIQEYAGEAPSMWVTPIPLIADIKAKMGKDVPTINLDTNVYGMERQKTQTQRVISSLIPDTFGQATILPLAILGSGVAVAVAPITSSILGATYLGYQGVKTFTGQTMEERAGATGQVAIGLATLGFLGAKAGIKAYKGKYGYEQFLKAPEGSITEKGVVVSVNDIVTPQGVPKLSIARKDNQAFIDIFAKPKSISKETTSEPTSTFIGNVEEFRPTPKTKFDIFKDIIGLNKEPKLQRNKGQYFEKEGKSVTEIDLGKGIKRVETKDITTGKGKIEIFKNDKLKVSRETKLSKEPQKGKVETKKSQIKVIIDEQSRQPFNIIDTDISAGKFRVKGKVVEPQNIEENIIPTEPNLVSKKIFGEIVRDTTTTRNLEKGTKRIVSQTKGDLDIITSQPRKALIEIRTPKGRIRVAKQVAQEIVYGEPKESDISKYFSKEGNMKQMRKISPKTTRETTNAQDVQIVDIFVNPKSKFVKELKAIEEVRTNKFREEIIKLDEQIKTNIRNKALREWGIEKKRQLRQFYDNFKAKQNINKDKNVLTFTREGEGVQRMVGGRGLQLEQLPRLNPEEQAFLANVETQVFIEAPVRKGISNPISTGMSNIEVTIIEPQVQTKTFFALQQLIKTDELSITKEKIIDLNKIITQEKIINQEKLLNKENVISQLKMNIKQEQQLQSKLMQEQKLQQVSKQVNRQKQNVREEQPITDEPIIFSGDYPKKKKKTITALELVGDMFEVFVKEKGKDVSIGEFKTKSEAGEVFRSKLKSGLEASGFVTSKKTGKKLSYGELSGILGTGFAPSRRESGRIIELKEYRLKSRPEISKAQKLRRGGTKWLS